MKTRMASISLLVIITSLVALLVGTVDMGSGHTVFASGHVTNRGINVQTDTSQGQGCEGVGGTSGITNACSATSTPATQMSVTLNFMRCISTPPFTSFACSIPEPPNGCNNIGCATINCVGPLSGANCITDNGVQLTSCNSHPFYVIYCTRTVPGTGITNSGGITGDS
jgi:hypothetical protein